MNFPRTVTDQMGTDVKLNHTPQRIISLVPSQTELLYDLGLENEVVGITKFCIHPESWYKSKTRVGGTKEFDMDKISGLQPDLIIGNKEENEESQIRELQSHHTVWMSDIHDLREATQMILSIGEITGRDERAAEIVSHINTGFEKLRTAVSEFAPKKCAYLIWRNPYMAAGENTFIDAMLKELHLENICTESRYPEVTLSELRDRAPEVLLLSSEPYPFSDKHLQEIRSVLPDTQVVLVDGEMFSWYGSRLQLSTEYFLKLIVKLHNASS